MQTNINEAGPVMTRSGFGRIFEAMYEGSMVGAGPHVFAVWPYVIAHMRGHAEYGALVELNPKLLGFILGAKEGDVAEAIDYLCAPDNGSRTKAEEGRRLVKLGQFLYRVVNGAGYLAIRRAEDKRFAHANRQVRYEAKKKARKSSRPVKSANEIAVEKADAAGDQAGATRIAEMADGVAPGTYANGGLDGVA